MAPVSALLLTASLVLSFFCIRNIMLMVLQHAGFRGVLALLRSSGTRELAKTRLLSLGPLERILQARKRKKRSEALERAMPQALRLLSIALGSGSSLTMALRYAAENCDEPLASELKHTVWDLEAGHGFNEALEKLRERTDGTEFAYLAVAMEIQHRSGGSLSDILENVSTMLQQSADLKEELRTKTSQGRLSSKIVAIMPFALLAILSVFSPDYLTSFVSSPLGACMFCLALLLEAAGIVFVRRALAIDFSVDLEQGA